MDYAGWELERQRRALAALLLGGGATREEEQNRRSPETAWRQAGAAGQTAAGIPGRYAGRSKDGSPEVPDTIRETRRDFRLWNGELETPHSAWEGIWGLEHSAGEDGTAELLANAGNPDRGGRPVLHGGGAGSGAALREVSHGRAVRALDGGAAPQRRRAAELPDPRPSSGGEGGGDGEFPGERSSGAAKEEAPARRQGGGWVPVSRRGEGTALPPSGTAVLVRGAPGEAALRAEEDARALSRAVQRDARRYDGGFALY